MQILWDNALLIIVMTILFAISNIYQYRRGFSDGSIGGFAVGVFHSSLFIKEKGMLDSEFKTLDADRLFSKVFHGIPQGRLESEVYDERISKGMNDK